MKMNFRFCATLTYLVPESNRISTEYRARCNGEVFRSPLSSIRGSSLMLRILVLRFQRL